MCGITHTYSFGMTPEDLIKRLANEQCPDGYPMTIRCRTEWAIIAACVNEGIDSHLEALTKRSRFDAWSGECLVHPDELHVLLRRLGECEWSENGEDGPGFRISILYTLGVEEI
jgi:hypothetical protein